MSFVETIERARALLGRSGRISLRVLQREFALDDTALEDLIEELVDVQQVAAREGKVLAWLGAARPAAAAPADAEEGERRQLTVLFCDLVGSTELAARMDPEDWQAVLRAYQERAGEVIAYHGGHVAQYLGDGLLVYFGWPRSFDDPAERAVRAGLGLVAAAAASLADGAPLAVRVGLHTGPVVVSALGREGRSETLALGDAPNVAARVQGAAEPGTVLITAATLRLVPGLFVLEERGAQALKGVREPVTLYRVVQPSGVRSRLETSVGHMTPFVGRQTELGVLRDAWDHVVEGAGQTVLVSGEAGLGKSRLCYELRGVLAKEPHTWLECRCTPYTAGTAFHHVKELVTQGLAFRAEDTPAEKLVKLTAGLERAGFPVAESVPLLADWLGLPVEAGYTPLALHPDVRRQRTLDTLAAWNLRLSQLQPLVLLTEDLHWCDPSSLELLGRIVAQSGTARVLVLNTARPEFQCPWPARSNLKTLTLERLTKRQARELIAAVSGAQALPDAVVEQLVARADGVPLFAEELTRSVAEVEASAAPAIPTTLQDSLLARLDRLSSAKEVAQRASVLGREFSYRLLAAVAELEEAALRTGLARLVEAELLFVRGEPPDATYTFKHALVQEAAYESLLKRTRQQLHGRVADALAADSAAAPEQLARHTEAAGRGEEAVAAYQRAGEEAQQRSAHEEAIDHLRRAIALLATLPEGRERDAREAALQLALAGSLRPARGIAHAETEAAYERARVVSEAAGDDRRLGLALGGLASFYSNAGDPGRGAALAARVLELAEQSGDGELALLGHAELGVAEGWQAKHASAVAHFETASGLYEQGRRALGSLSDGDPGVMPLSYLDLGIIALCSGSWSLGPLGWLDRALASARRAVALAHELRDPFNLGYALTAECIVHATRRDVTAQRQRAEEAIALSEPNGFLLWLGLCRFFHGAARVATGEHGAVADMLAGMGIAAQTGTQAGAPALLATLAETQLIAGQLAEAGGTIDMALAIAAQTGQPGSDAELHRLRGELALARAEGPSSRVLAEECFRRALDVTRAQEAKTYELRAATSLAGLWHDQGRRDEARSVLAPVYGWFTEGLDTGDLRDAKALLDALG